MWIAPPHRGRGHGGTLLRTILDWAEGWGATEMGLWAPRDQPVAVALYRSVGFEPNGKVREHRRGMHILEMIRLSGEPFK